MFALKKGGLLRFGANCRKLDRVTVQGSYSILGIDEWLDSIDDATFF